MIQYVMNLPLRQRLRKGYAIACTKCLNNGKLIQKHLVVIMHRSVITLQCA